MALARARMFPAGSDRKTRTRRLRVMPVGDMVTNPAACAGKEAEAVNMEDTLSQKFCRYRQQQHVAGTGWDCTCVT